ncbi:calcium-binding protein [Maricaulis salignorans]|uniref:calcium-binding protein n=1 Tax=Maricaulis salignorans TaxID=144026 RepID=UPI003A8E6FD9
MDSLKILSGQDFDNEDVAFAFDGTTLNVDYGRWSPARPEDNLMRGGDLSLGVDLLLRSYDWSGTLGTAAVERLDDGSTALVMRNDAVLNHANGNAYGTRWELDGGRNYAVNGGDYVSFAFEARQLDPAQNGSQDRLSMYVTFHDAAGVKLGGKWLHNAYTAEWERRETTVQANAGTAFARVYLVTFGGLNGQGTADATADLAARNIQFNRSSTPFAEIPGYSAPVYERFTLDDFLTDGGFRAMAAGSATTPSLQSQTALMNQALALGHVPVMTFYTLDNVPGSDASSGNDIHIHSGSSSITLDDSRTELVTMTYSYWDYGGPFGGQEMVLGELSGSFTWTGGDDVFVGGDGNDTMYGRGGYDWLSGGDGDDVIYGGSEDDVILGGGGSDRLFGEDGDDYIAVGAGRDYHKDVNGVWTWFGAKGGNGNDTLVASLDQTYLWGENDDDLLILADGNAAWSRFDGGNGNDTLSAERFSAGVTVDMRVYYANDPNSAWRTVLGDQHFTNIENFTGSEFDDDLTGDDSDNVLRGLGGDDTLRGGGGNDTLEGGRGADTLVGNGGADIASYKHSSSAVWIDLESAELFGGDAEGDTFNSIERVIGSDFDDTIFSKASQSNRFWGGRGDDWFVAAGGSDYFYGDADFDTVDYADMTSAVTVNLATNTGGGAAAGNKYYDIEHIVGTDFADNITADGNDNYLQGGLGNDTLTGGAGLDTYVYNFGDGQDVIVEAEDTGGYDTLVIMGVNWSDVTLNFPNGDLMITLTGGGSIFVNDNQANWSVEGTGIDAIDIGGVGTVDIGYLMSGNRGGNFADTLYSTHNHGNIEDIIMGRAGADMIYSWRQGDSTDSADNLIWAGRDNDTIRTGSGDDTFIYDRGDGVDTIYDSGGYDRIQFGPSVYADDVIYEVVGNDLVIGLRDDANPEYTASQVADRLIIKNAGGSNGAGNRVEYITAGGVDIDINKLGIEWTYVAPPPPPPIGGGPGGGGPGGGWGDGPLPPVVFDLGGDGLDLVSVNESRVVYDAGNGTLFRLGWVGASDGFLALDRDGDGIINNRTEISFVGDFEGATTDLEGLQGFDSNADGVLDARDAMWGEFRIWQDVNQNGVGTAGELMSLEAAGIVSLNLALTSTGRESGSMADSFSLNTAIATRADGTTLIAHDVALQMLQARAEGSALPGAELRNGLDWSANGTFGVAYTGEAFDPANLAALMTSWTVNDAGPEGAAWTSLFQHIDLEDLLAAPVYEADPNAPQTETFGVKPIVIDMDGDGIELINPGQSPIEFDANDDGAFDQIGWVSSDDAILGLDRDGDGLISGIPEISFVGDVAGAQTDLEGLNAFDSNANGWLDAGDSRFGDFRIWVDGNYDAVSDAGELRTLDEAGLTQLSLTSVAGSGVEGGNLGNTIFGQSNIIWADGVTGGMAGDVELRAYTGSLEQQIYDTFMRQMLVQQGAGPWGFDRTARRGQMMELRSENVGPRDEADQSVVPLGKYAHTAGGRGLAGSAGSQQGLRAGAGAQFDPNGMLAFNASGAGALTPDFAANDARRGAQAFGSGDMQRWWLAFAGENGSGSMGPRTLAERLAALDASREQVGPAGAGRAGLPQQDAGALAEQQRFLQAMAAFNGSSGVATLRKGDQVSNGQYNLFASRSELSSQADANKLGMYG